jgi:DNA polymerase-1
MKIVNFSCTYGSTKYGLANRFGLTTEEGEGYLNSYYEAYPEVKQFQEDMFKFAQDNGYVKTLLGRKRRLPQLTYIGDDSWKNKYSSSFDVGNLRNVSFNSVIQGTSGQTTIIAMTNTWKEIKKRNLKTRLIINVHDEIVDLVHISEIEEYTKIKEYWMTYPYYENQKGATITLSAEQGFGEVWKNEKSLKYWKDNDKDFQELGIALIFAVFYLRH